MSDSFPRHFDSDEFRIVWPSSDDKTDFVRLVFGEPPRLVAETELDTDAPHPYENPDDF